MRRARKKVTQNHLLTTTDGGDCTTRVSSSLEDERKAPTSPVQRIRHNKGKLADCTRSGRRGSEADLDIRKSTSREAHLPTHQTVDRFPRNQWISHDNETFSPYHEDIAYAIIRKGFCNDKSLGSNTAFDSKRIIWNFKVNIMYKVYYDIITVRR